MNFLKKLARKIQERLGIAENRYRIAKIEEGIQKQSLFQNTLFNMYAGQVFIPEEINVFTDKAVSMAIHKNDLMLHNQLWRNLENSKYGIEEYFQIGMEGASGLKAITEENGCKTRSILDFGSGYGRMSRFLPHFFPDSGIIVSEVKAQAMEFQKSEFGFSTLTHGNKANTFPEVKYDLISALSVFTHLNETDFREWLKVLTDSLTNEGSLVFTYNDIAKSPAGKEKNFVFIKTSEDSNFNYVSDALTDTSSYGSTFIKREYLSELIEQVGYKPTYLRDGLAGKQDSVLIQKPK